MILPLGSLINAGAVILGGSLGLVLGNRLSGDMRRIVFQGLGLCTLVLGVQMAITTQNPLVMIFSVLLGCVLGELIRLEDLFNGGGNALKRLLRSGSGTFTEGFVSATLLFCVGSMAILGSLEEGLGSGRNILLTKSMLDGFAAMALASALGAGVLLASLSVLVYQGAITIFAVYLQNILSAPMQRELIATGGVLIIAIGFNLLEAAKIRLSNMLPALLFAVLLMYVIGAG